MVAPAGAGGGVTGAWVGAGVTGALWVGAGVTGAFVGGPNVGGGTVGCVGTSKIGNVVVGAWEVVVLPEVPDVPVEPSSGGGVGPSVSVPPLLPAGRLKGCPRGSSNK